MKLFAPRHKKILFAYAITKVQGLSGGGWGGGGSCVDYLISIEVFLAISCISGAGYLIFFIS